MVFASGDELSAADLHLSDVESASPLHLMLPGVTLAELERFAILKTLEAVGGSRSEAAKLLGVSRRMIQYRMKQWGLAPPTKDTQQRRS